MTPSAPEPADLPNRLRQQLILAQVRIMELEDARDTLAPKIAELETQLRAAQQLADTKLDEAAHAARVLADTQAHAAALQRQLDQAARDLAAFSSMVTERDATLARLERDLADTRAQLAAEQSRHAAELARVTSSRSWRWTAWLRALTGSS